MLEFLRYRSQTYMSCIFGLFAVLCGFIILIFGLILLTNGQELRIRLKQHQSGHKITLHKTVEIFGKYILLVYCLALIIAVALHMRKQKTFNIQPLHLYVFLFLLDTNRNINLASWQLTNNKIFIRL